jgi:hypothetical protein
MSLSQVRNVNFGKLRANLTGSGGVGYALLDQAGSTLQPRTTTGVYQLTSGSGIYGSNISFPDNWRGQILWDSGVDSLTISGGLKYATEQYNYEENNPKVDSIYDIEHGRWKIIGNQMVFYKEDNVTEVARFNLFDEFGVPTTDAVFERQRV